MAKREIVGGLNAIFGTLLLAWPVAVGVSVRMFDRAGNLDSPVALAAVVATWIYPAFAIGGIVISRRALKRRLTRGRAIAWALLPAIDLLAIALTGFWQMSDCAGLLNC